MYDFSTLKKSGLKIKGELDALLGVSRITIYGYLDKQIPSAQRAPRVTETLKVLDALIQKGQLPLSKDRTRDDRKKAVEKIRAHVDARLQ